MNKKQYANPILAHNLKRLCAERNIKQRQLAEVCGKERKSAMNWINCVSQPSAQDLYWICKRYNVSADYILGLKE